ncbi:hypothetical protein Tco_1222004, partial [Tanacetum coccineum]
MDSAGSRRQIGVSPFADSAADPSPFMYISYDILGRD